MPLTWTRESPARWDADKARILGGAAPGSLPEMAMPIGDLAPGDWFRVERDGQVVGYGWMDVVWGDAEILLAVAPEARGNGVGTFILDQIALEARAQGLRRIHNSVRPNHPERQTTQAWLGRRGFSGGEGHESLERRLA